MDPKGVFESLSPESRKFISEQLDELFRKLTRDAAQFMISVIDAMIHNYKLLPEAMIESHDTITKIDAALRGMDSDYAMRPRWDEGFGPRCTRCLREYREIDTECYPAEPGSLLPQAYCMDQEKKDA